MPVFTETGNSFNYFNSKMARWLCSTKENTSYRVSPAGCPSGIDRDATRFSAFGRQHGLDLICCCYGFPKGSQVLLDGLKPALNYLQQDSSQNTLV